PVNPTTGVCNQPIATVASNWVANSANGVCDPCPSSCLACSIPSSTNNTGSLACTKCMTGFVLDGVNCVRTCSQGKFVNPADNMTCIPCDSSCGTCKGSAPNQCLTCSNPSQFALNGTCSATPCPTGFVSVNTACTKCHPDCAECSGPGVSQCTKCPANRPIMTKDNQCVEVCPVGTYADVNAKCQACDGSCSSCVGPRDDQCLGCSDKNKVLIGGSCSGTCPSGSTLLQSERLCGTSDGLTSPIAPVPISSKSLPWWAIFLIVLAALIFIGLGTYIVHYYAVRRRQKKIEEFGDQLDEQAVTENLQQLQAEHESTHSRTPSNALSEPQTSYQPFANNLVKQKESEKELDTESFPPAYDPRDGEEYWKKLKRANSKLSRKASILSRFGESRKKDDWEGFEEVTLNEKGVVRSGSGNGKGKAHEDNKRSGRFSSWGENWI
ncbi:576_t:CDS:2, partial [Paraglomus occultum]